MADDEFTQDLFRFLQLLCEGHNNGERGGWAGRRGHRGRGFQKSPDLSSSGHTNLAQTWSLLSLLSEEAHAGEAILVTWVV